MKRIGKAALAMTVLLLATTVPGPERSARGEIAPDQAATASAKEWTDFTLKDASGKPVSLAPLIGERPVLLIFWATWCPNCKENVPVVNRMHKEPARNGNVQILALDYMESPEKVKAFIEANMVAFPVLLDRKGTVAKAYKVVGVPTYVLIDRDGRIAFRGHELPEINKVLD
jgi:peroxiredoxin